MEWGFYQLKKQNEQARFHLRDDFKSEWWSGHYLHPGRNQLDEIVLQDVMHLLGLSGGEQIEKIAVGIEFHVFVFEKVDAGECICGEVFAKGEGMYGLGDFLVGEEEDKTGEVDEEDEFIALDEKEVAIVEFVELLSQEMDEFEESGWEVGGVKDFEHDGIDLHFAMNNLGRQVAPDTFQQTMYGDVQHVKCGFVICRMKYVGDTLLQLLSSGRRLRWRGGWLLAHSWKNEMRKV